VPDPNPDPTPGTPAEVDIREALERARSGDRGSLPALRAALDAHPEIWEQYGDLAAHARHSWVQLIAGTDLALAEALTRKAAALGAELAGSSPTPLEGLLVSRIVACWLQVHYADAAVAQAGAVSIRQSDLALKRQARAHKGYLMAIAALATVRRLLPAAPVSSDTPVGGDRKPGLAGSGDEAPAAGDDQRIGGLPGSGKLVLFGRAGAVSDSDDGPGSDRGLARSAS
jgi:hypothetical protein